MTRFAAPIDIIKKAQLFYLKMILHKTTFSTAILVFEKAKSGKKILYHKQRIYVECSVHEDEEPDRTPLQI